MILREVIESPAGQDRELDVLLRDESSGCRDRSISSRDEDALRPFVDGLP